MGGGDGGLLLEDAPPWLQPTALDPPWSLGLGGLGLATSPWAAWRCLAAKAEGHNGGVAEDELGGAGP